MNLLFTSSGRRSYLLEYFREALNNNGSIHACNIHQLVSSYASVDYFVKSPPIHSDSYIDFLLNYCESHKIDAIIPFFDIDIPVLAKSKSRFDDAGVRMLVPSLEIAETCNDKYVTFEFLKRNQLSCPNTFYRLEDVENAISTGGFNFPCIIKPRWGMGSIGIYKANNEEELKFFFNYSKKEIFDSYLKYESKVDYEHCVIVQEHMGGTEYGLDLINDLEGNPITVFVKEKIAMRSGETDIAITRNMPELKDFGFKLAKLTNHLGIMDVDVFYEGDDIKVVDMNARFGGGYPFSHLAGANIPLAIVHWLNNIAPPEECFQVKYDFASLKDIQPKPFNYLSL